VGVLALEIIVYEPRLAAVNRIDVAAAARVEREHAPGGWRREQADQRGRADERRLHALYDGVADELRADLPADNGASAIAAAQIACAQRERLAAVEVGETRENSVVL